MFDKFLEQKELFLSDLKDFLKIPSVSSDKKAINDAVDFLVDLGTKFGLDAKYHFDKEVVTIEYGEGDEIFGVLAHLDVVPVVSEEWSFEPFDLTLKDGVLYGRGVVDDKGPVIMMLYILKIFKENNVKTNKKIQLIVGTQEEVHWSDMIKYVECNKLPSFGFTPDGSFPIQNAEKGYMDIKLIFDRENIEMIKGGVASNSIPSEFYCKIDGAEYSATGKTVHSSRPYEGVNAIYEGIKKIHSDNKTLEFIEKYLFDYYGKGLGIYEESFVNDDILNLTTLALTLINVVDDKIEMVINFRTAKEKTRTDILDRFTALQKEYNFDIEVLEYMKPVYVDKNSGFIKIMKEIYEENTGTEVAFSLATCATYAKAMDNFVSFGPLFPESKYSLHESDEEFVLEELLLAQKIYFDVIYKIVTTNDKLLI